MTTLFLTPDELVELTGYRRKSAQIAWLSTHGWRFAVSAGGYPRVARAYLERRMVARSPGPAVESAAPDFGALRA